jgi:hypothetical protein
METKKGEKNNEQKKQTSSYDSNDSTLDIWSEEVAPCCDCKETDCSLCSFRLRPNM